MFNYVAHTLYAAGGGVTLNANASASDPTLARRFPAVQPSPRQRRSVSPTSPSPAPASSISRATRSSSTTPAQARSARGPARITPAITGLIANGRIVNSTAQPFTAMGVYESSQLLGAGGGSFAGLSVDGLGGPASNTPTPAMRPATEN